MKWGGNMNLITVTMANLKKKKGAMISIGILIVLASLLLNAGLLTMLNAGKIVESKMQEQNGPHFVFTVSSNKYMPEYKTYFEEDNRVSEVEVEEVVAMDVATTSYGGGNMELGAIFQNQDEVRTILPIQVIESLDVAVENGIFLPIGMKSGSPALGEEFPITYKNKKVVFTVAGYFESPVFGTPNTGYVKYLLPGEVYERFHNEMGGGKMISVRLNDPHEANALKNDFKELTDYDLADESISKLRVTYEDICFTGTAMPKIFSKALLMFAIVILLVAMLVTKFRISANIDDNIHNIGALGAIGYTSGQIMMILLLEFALVSFFGALIGVFLSWMAIPILGVMLTSVSGVVWTTGIDLLVNIISIILLMAFVLSVTLFDLLRVRKLPPIVALRGGLMTHNFNKNHFPLEKEGRLHLKLAGKYALANPKQNIMLAGVLLGVTVIMIISGTLYSNMVADKAALIRMAGVELSDVLVHLTPHTDAKEFIEEISGKNGIRKTSMLDITMLTVEDRELMAFISDDFSTMESLGVYEGVMPKYDNEVVISGAIANTYHKSIGDTIQFQLGDVSEEFIITGLTQSLNMAGRVAYITLPGMQILNPYYKQKTINIYLEEGVDIDEFIEKMSALYSVQPVEGDEKGQWAELIHNRVREKMSNLLALYGVDSLQYAMMVDGQILLQGSSENYKIERMENYAINVQAQTYSLGAMITSLFQTILVFSVLIVTLIISMVIGAMIRKWKREFGIFKAIGYTTSQLTLQIMWSFLPAILAGVVLGALSGCISANPLFYVMFHKVGISNMQFSINTPMIIGICVSIIAFTCLIALLSAYRIRKVSVYDLLSE